MKGIISMIGGILVLALLYPLSYGPAQRFYLHAYKVNNMAVRRDNSSELFDREERCYEFYGPLFNHFKVVDDSLNWYGLLWLGGPPKIVPQSN